jgi:hypothetical protein
MTYWYDDTLPIEVHGNWWWQPSGVITPYPLPDNLGVCMHISDLAGAMNRDEAAIERLRASWWDWCNEDHMNFADSPEESAEQGTLEQFVERHLVMQAHQLCLRVNRAVVGRLSMWLDPAMREDYFNALEQYPENEAISVEGIARFLGREHPAIAEAVRNIEQAESFRSFAESVMRLEMERTFPGALASFPDMLTSSSSTAKTRLWISPPVMAIDLKELQAFVYQEWQDMGFDLDEPLTHDRLLGAALKIFERWKQKTSIRDVEAYGHALDGLAHYVMREIDKRPEAERVAIVDKQLPIHILQSHDGLPLFELTGNMALKAQNLPEEKTLLHGFLDNAGRVYAYMPYAAYEPCLPPAGGWFHRLLQAKAVPEQVNDNYNAFDKALKEELTHRVQLSDFQPEHFHAPGFYTLLKAGAQEIFQIMASEEIDPFQKMQMTDITRPLTSLLTTLDMYTAGYDQSIESGTMSMTFKEYLQDAEAYAKFHDMWVGLDEEDQLKMELALPFLLHYFHELQFRLQDLLPHVQEERAAADRAAAEWLIAQQDGALGGLTGDAKGAELE